MYISLDSAKIMNQIVSFFGFCDKRKKNCRKAIRKVYFLCICLRNCFSRKFLFCYLLLKCFTFHLKLIKKVDEIFMDWTFLLLSFHLNNYKPSSMGPMDCWIGAMIKSMFFFINIIREILHKRRLSDVHDLCSLI